MVNRANRVGIVLQARVGSTRLPGKVLMPLAGKPMIQWIIERLKACRKAEMLILATTSMQQDDALADLAKDWGVVAFRGSGSDVLDRYYKCARKYGLTDIVRATGDNPFVDAEECDRLVDFYSAERLDFAIGETGTPSGYPLGVSVEVFNFKSIEKSWQEGHAPHHREHVDEYMLENPGLFRQARMSAPPEKSAHDLSLTVDTSGEFAFVESIYREWHSTHPGEHVPVPAAIAIALRHGVKV